VGVPLVTVVALAADPILELALDLVERAIRRRSSTTRRVPLRGLSARDELFAGETDVDRHVKAISVAMVMAGELDDDVARNEAVRELVELVGSLFDARRERVRVRHASKRDL
jgi:hypothetical protein